MQMTLTFRKDCKRMLAISRFRKQNTSVSCNCLPVLLHGLEARPLTKSDLQSLDFVIDRFFTKLFTTKSIETVIPLPSVLWATSQLRVFFYLCYNCLISFVNLYCLLFYCLPCLPGE